MKKLWLIILVLAAAVAAIALYLLKPKTKDPDPIRAGMLETFAPNGSNSQGMVTTRQALHAALLSIGGDGVKVIERTDDCNDKGCLADVEYPSQAAFDKYVGATQLAYRDRQSPFGSHLAASGRTTLLKRDGKLIATWFFVNPHLDYRQEKGTGSERAPSPEKPRTEEKAP